MTSTISTRTTVRRARRMSLALTPVAAVALLLSACGGSGAGPGSGEGTGVAAGASPTTSPGAGQGGQNDRRGLGGMDFTKVQQCLDAAGIDLTLPTFDPDNRPSGMPRRSFDPNRTARPSPPADGSLPSSAPRMPGQGFGGGQGGPGGALLELFTDPDVRAALNACGITLPQRPQGDRPGASATPST